MYNVSGHTCICNRVAISACLEPRSCVITKDDLHTDLRVLFYMEGLFYEGKVKEIQPPDV